jgi:hypothetical protein
MKCPDCKGALVPYYGPERVVIGVECTPCKRQWTSERVERIGDDLRESMYRQITNIVKHMDFSTDCIEVRRD